MIENNFKKYSAEKVCGMFLRTYYLLYHSVFLHVPIYFFLCSFTILSFPMWELRSSPSSFLGSWLWSCLWHITHYFSLRPSHKVELCLLSSTCPSHIPTSLQLLDCSSLCLVLLFHPPTAPMPSCPGQTCGSDPLQLVLLSGPLGT